jgi:hypothetical protein
MDDFEKYILEQAKSEVEQNRSWPTKILAFYVAINFALVSGLFSSSSPTLSDCWRWLLILLVVVMSIWVIALFRKNHLNYLRYRNVQVTFQVSNAEALKEKKLSLPDEWFAPYVVSSFTRFIGWGFYAFLVVFIMFLSIAGIWVS